MAAEWPFESNGSICGTAAPRIFLFGFVLLYAQPQPLLAQEESEGITLEQIQQGLQSVWSTVQTRHIRVSQTPWNVRMDDASAAHPDRTEIDVTTTAAGKYLVKTTVFRGDQVTDTRIQAFDGQRRSSVREWPGKPVEVDYHQMPLQTDGIWETMTLTYANKPFHEMLTEFPSRILGPIDVNGCPCVRTETIVPPKFNGRPTTTEILLDIDVSMGFWPRRILARLETDDKGLYKMPPGPQEVLEFKQTDGIWYPSITKTQWLGKELALQYVTEAEFNREYELTMFQPKGPVGAMVSDQNEMRTYIQGGEGGREKRQSELAAAARDEESPGDRIPVSTNEGTWSLTSILGLVGLAMICVGGISAVRRRYLAVK
jgi:hypothetical protein